MAERTEQVDGVNGATPAPTPKRRGLEELFQYPLMTALTERRTRRVARGVSVDSGELSWHSTNEPTPLSKLEEALLIVSTGITGITIHDGPLMKPDGGQELGTPFLNILARAASSADNAQATALFMINDEGIWLLKRPRGQEALDLLGQFPQRWGDWTEDDWIAAAAAVKVRIWDKRLEFPRIFPYYLGWNKQLSNRPGTTIFFPVVDCTRQTINALLILLSEPDGQRPLFIDDWQPFRPKTPSDWVAWAGMKLRLLPDIPYHPIGGIRRAQSKFINKDNTIPLGAAHTMRTDHESFLLLQNLMLLGQGMGLGGWIHSAVFPQYIFQRDEAKGWYGLGFRHAVPTVQHRRWPPVPASQAHPVGIDGVLEGLCPPYVTSLDDAVEQVLAEKHGAQGAYADRGIFARSYRSAASGEAYLRHAAPHPPGAIKYTKEICNYIYETYGRFPAHIDAFYTPGIWLQFSHLEMEYYEQFYDPALFRQQARHDELWDRD